MTKTFKLACLAGAVALLPAIAQAQTPEGAYVAIQGGVNFNQDTDADAAGVSGEVDTDLGYAAGAAAGYAFGGGPRVELETTWRSNGVDSVGNFGSNGSLNSVAVMANAIYDVPLGMDFYPYFGAGVGMAWLLADVNNPATGAGVDDSDITFAYQGIAGMGYNITDNIGVTMDYRFLGTLGTEFDGVEYDPYLNHTVMFGLRYSFTKPEPMMVEEVVEETVIEVPESYLVFFDFDSSAITPEASGIIGTAATNAKATGSSMIEVTGHADRSGPADYNMGLSMRRAEAVMAELERNGIPRTDVAVYAKGETDPLVPTPDGVREPQNRRVVIVLK